VTVTIKDKLAHKRIPSENVTVEGHRTVTLTYPFKTGAFGTHNISATISGPVDFSSNRMTVEVTVMQTTPGFESSLLFSSLFLAGFITHFIRKSNNISRPDGRNGGLKMNNGPG
jgi:hypothetical protein